MNKNFLKVMVVASMLLTSHTVGASSLTIMAIDGEPSKISWLRNGEVLKIEPMAAVEPGDKFFIKDKSTVLKILTSSSGVIRVSATDSPFTIDKEEKSASIFSNGRDWVKGLISNNIPKSSDEGDPQVEVRQVVTATTRNASKDCSRHAYSLTGLTQQENYLIDNMSSLTVPISYCGASASVMLKSKDTGILDFDGLAVSLLNTQDENIKLTSRYSSSSISFNDYSLPVGVYKVVLSKNGKELDSRKVIVKSSDLMNEFDIRNADFDELSALAIEFKDSPEWNFMAMQLAYNAQNVLLANSFSDRHFDLVDK